MITTLPKISYCIVYLFYILHKYCLLLAISSDFCCKFHVISRLSLCLDSRTYRSETLFTSCTFHVSKNGCKENWESYMMDDAFFLCIHFNILTFCQMDAESAATLLIEVKSCFLQCPNSLFGDKIMWCFISSKPTDPGY